MTRIAMTRDHCQQITDYATLRPGVEVYRLDASKLYGSLDPHQPAIFAGTVISIDEEYIVIETETGRKVSCTYGTNASHPLYIVRENTDAGVAATPVKSVFQSAYIAGTTVHIARNVSHKFYDLHRLTTASVARLSQILAKFEARVELDIDLTSTIYFYPKGY